MCSFCKGCGKLVIDVSPIENCSEAFFIVARPFGVELSDSLMFINFLKFSTLVYWLF